MPDLDGKIRDGLDGGKKGASFFAHLNVARTTYSVAYEASELTEPSVDASANITEKNTRMPPTLVLT